MNWVAPIKDEKTLDRYREQLKSTDIKYYILFELGVGTGLQLQDILQFRVKDVRGKDIIEVYIGTKKIKRSLRIEGELKEAIESYTEGRDPEEFLFMGRSDTGEMVPLSREQAYRALKAAGKMIGLSAIGAQTMRKTFAWHYYKETGDIYYLQNLLNHASPSITYRYIGEKPNVEAVMNKLTPEENERSRRLLHQDNNGQKRIDNIRRVLSGIEEGISDPGSNDAYYGRVDCLLTEMEELIKEFESSVR